MIVYKITCTVNGKAYIGKTKRSLHDRWRSHCSQGSGCWALAGAIRKYGKDAFVLEVLACDLDDEAAERVEREMVHRHGTKAPAGYNLTEGGQGSAHKNPEHGKNIAKAWQREETRERHMAWRTSERMSAKANEDSTWRRQQMAWMQKRLDAALKLPPLEASRQLWYKATKCRENAVRSGRTSEQLEWMDGVRDEQIATVWRMANLPAPPASSWAQTAHEYERNKQRAVVQKNMAVGVRDPVHLEALGVLADGAVSKEGQSEQVDMYESSSNADVPDEGVVGGDKAEAPGGNLVDTLCESGEESDDWF